jgi:hypothetical protein
MLRCVEVQVAVGEFNAAVGLPRNVRIMRDHEDRMAGVVQLTENLDDDDFPSARPRGSTLAD